MFYTVFFFLLHDFVQDYMRNVILFLFVKMFKDTKQKYDLFIDYYCLFHYFFYTRDKRLL